MIPSMIWWLKRCSNVHNIGDISAQGPHPVFFPFCIAVKLVLCFYYFERLCQKCLFTRGPTWCFSVMDWINSLRMKPASFCLFTLTSESPSHWDCEVTSLLAHQEAPFIITSFDEAFCWDMKHALQSFWRQTETCICFAGGTQQRRTKLNHKETESSRKQNEVVK